MKELTLPVRHEWRVRERAYGKIAIEPFAPGFALTVGNAYRRVLLSSIAGAAPTWVKIEGVLHEFSYLPGEGAARGRRPNLIQSLAARMVWISSRAW
jgi:DNA-directed RNA polymerase subunit alpha